MLQEGGRVHLPPVRQRLSNEAQFGETFEIRVRRAQAFCLQFVPGKIHAERQIKAAHVKRAQYFRTTAKDPREMRLQLNNAVSFHVLFLFLEKVFSYAYRSVNLCNVLVAHLK